MHYLIWLDEHGKEVKRKPKSRGRGPRGFVQKEDGHWYCQLPKSIEQKAESSSQAIEGSEGDEQPIQAITKRVAKVIASARTQPSRIMQACSVLSCENDIEKFTLMGPIIAGITGLPELDSLDGQSIFHKMEINIQTSTVTLWSVTSPEDPCLIIQDALSTVEGQKNAD